MCHTLTLVLVERVNIFQGIVITTYWLLSVLQRVGQCYDNGK